MAGYESLSEDVIRRLMASEDFRTLPPSLQRRILDGIALSPSSLVAEVDGAAIIVTNQWVVSIHGDDLAHCVAVLVKYRNVVATELAAVVTGNLYTPVVENTGPLRELVARREKKSRFKDNAVRVGWMFAGAVMALVLGYIVSLLAGG